MRILREEDELVERLITELGEHADVRVFDSQSLTVKQAIGLFHKALVVVGVHGGALSNVAFCRPGTLLAEIAFRAPQVGERREKPGCSLLSPRLLGPALRARGHGAGLGLPAVLCGAGRAQRRRT